MKATRLVAALTGATLVLGASVAPAQTAKDTLSFSFSTTKRKAPAGYQLQAEFPRQREIDQITVTFPKDTRFDTKALPRCPEGSADEVTAAGGPSEFCPGNSRVGTGTGQAYIGADATSPTSFDLVIFNQKGGQLIDIRAGGQSAFSTRSVYRGRTAVTDLSLTPQLDARITAMSLDIDRAGTKRKPYLRTPAACPASKQLTVSIAAREFQGATETTRDKTPCRRG